MTHDNICKWKVGQRCPGTLLVKEIFIQTQCNIAFQTIFSCGICNLSFLKQKTSKIKKIFFGFSRIFAVTSKYLLAEITICSRRIIQRTIIFSQKPNIIDLVLQTIFFNIGHSAFINSMLYWEIWPRYEVARDSLRATNKLKNITLEKRRKWLKFIANWNSTFNWHTALIMTHN